MVLMCEGMGTPLHLKEGNLKVTLWCKEIAMHSHPKKDNFIKILMAQRNVYERQFYDNSYVEKK